MVARINIDSNTLQRRQLNLQTNWYSKKKCDKTTLHENLLKNSNITTITIDDSEDEGENIATMKKQSQCWLCKFAEYVKYNDF